MPPNLLARSALLLLLTGCADDAQQASMLTEPDSAGPSATPGALGPGALGPAGTTPDDPAATGGVAPPGSPGVAGNGPGSMVMESTGGNPGMMANGGMPVGPAANGGGMPAGPANVGGMPVVQSGGSSGSVGVAGSSAAGAPVSNGGSTPVSTGVSCDAVNFAPKCELLSTAAGAEIAKGTACTPDDPLCCYRTCGPQSIGWKSETCLDGVYMEGDCLFPDGGDYSCFAIPEAIDATVCPSDAAPQASQECDVPECTVCNLDGSYLDSSGSAKAGYCICQAPSSSGTRTWSCGSETAWPCPLGQGC